MIQSYQVAGRAVAENIAAEILKDDELLAQIFRERIQKRTQQEIAELFLRSRYENLSISVAQSALSMVFKRLLTEKERQEISNATKYSPTKDELSRGGKHSNSHQPIIREEAGYGANGKYLWDKKSDSALLLVLLDPTCWIESSKRGEYQWNIVAMILNDILKLEKPLSTKACRNRYIKIRKKTNDYSTVLKMGDQIFDPTNAASSTSLVE